MNIFFNSITSFLSNIIEVIITFSEILLTYSENILSSIIRFLFSTILVAINAAILFVKGFTTIFDLLIFWLSSHLLLNRFTYMDILLLFITIVILIVWQISANELKSVKAELYQYRSELSRVKSELYTARTTQEKLRQLVEEKRWSDIIALLNVGGQWVDRAMKILDFLS